MKGSLFLKLVSLLLFTCSAVGAQTLYRYENFLLNQNGTPVVGASIYVCTGNVTPNFFITPPCALATIYSDAAGTAQITQPVSTSPLGNYSFFLPGAKTYTVAGTGANITLTDILTIPMFPGIANYGNKSFQNVVYVDSTFSYGGSDIGDEINKAYAALPANGGEIDVSPNATASCYSFTVPIVLTTRSKYVLIRGLGSSSESNVAISSGACLNYTPTTATTALTLDYVPPNGGGNTRNHGIENIRLINNQCNTTVPAFVPGCGSAAVGISCASTNAGCQNATFDRLEVVGFGTGMKLVTPASSSQASWGINLNKGAISYNATGLTIANGIELTTLDDMKILGNTTGVTMGASSDLAMFGGSCDANTTICITSTGGDISTYGVHYENQNQNNAQYINAGLSLHIYGGLALDDCASSASCGNVTPPYWFFSPAIFIHGQDINTAGRVPTVVYKYSTSGVALGVTNISLIPRGNVFTTVNGNGVGIINDTALATVEAALFEADSGGAAATFSCTMVGSLTGWGSTASCGNPLGGNQRFSFVIVSNGTGITANPSLRITLTTPWPIAPLYQCKIIGGTGVPALVTGDGATISTTVIGPLIFNGTPAGGGATYQFACMGI